MQITYYVTFLKPGQVKMCTVSTQQFNMRFYNISYFKKLQKLFNFVWHGAS